MNRVFSKELAKLNRGRCPDCGGQMLAGPSGGMSQNIMCEDCTEEFNMMGGFGADRMGKNAARARNVYGIEEQPVAVKAWLHTPGRERPKAKLPFWKRWFGS